MKLEIETKQLAKILTSLKPFISSRAMTMPILSHVLISMKDGKVTFATTDLEMSGSITVDCGSMDEAATTVNFGMLTELVSILKGKTVELETNERGTRVKIKCGTHRGELPAIEADDFPIITTIEPDVAIQLPTADLAKAVSGVVYAASVDESRPTLTGVETTITETGIVFAATDGYRLAKYTLATPCTVEGKTTVVIPAGTLKKVAAAANGFEEVEVGITPNQNRISFQFVAPGETFTIASAIIDARFPDYNAIVPKTHAYQATIGADEFTMAIKAAMLTARSEAGQTHLSFTRNWLTVTAKSPESEASTEIKIAYDNADAESTFNGKYLLATLAALNCENVVIEGSEPTRPIVMYGAATGKDVLLAIIMPMHPGR